MALLHQDLLQKLQLLETEIAAVQTLAVGPMAALMKLQVLLQEFLTVVQMAVRLTVDQMEDQTVVQMVAQILVAA